MTELESLRPCNDFEALAWWSTTLPFKRATALAQNAPAIGLL